MESSAAQEEVEALFAQRKKRPLFHRVKPTAMRLNQAKEKR
jgi:hypothetical protein